jgi:hypothetical protein
LNQDGISQSNELKTLAASGVQSIKLTSTPSTQQYGDAMLVQNGSFTRVDAGGAITLGQAGSFILAQNNAATAFVPIAVSAAAKALPAVSGSGWVRGLQEAATLSPELVAMVNQAQTAPTREGHELTMASLCRFSKNYCQGAFKENLVRRKRHYAVNDKKWRVLA